jgi:hypothetical protein
VYILLIYGKFKSCLKTYYFQEGKGKIKDEKKNIFSDYAGMFIGGSNWLRGLLSSRTHILSWMPVSTDR